MEPQNESAERDTTPGEWLSQSRSQQGLTLQQAAERLNLDVWVLEALEANRFAALGPPVYAKGHLRKYAALLGLPVEEMVARYERLSDTPTVQDPIPATVAAPIRGVRPESSKWPRVIAALVIVAVLAGIAVALVKFNKRSMGTGQEEFAPQVSSPVSDAPTQASAATPNQSAPVHPAEVAAVPPAASPVAAKIEQAPQLESQQASSQADVTIRLEFSDTSWTEVYDATGKRLMFDNGVAGRVRTLTGTAPLKVTVGLASGVKLEVNGKSAVIPRRPGRESARFTIGPDGTVSEG